MQVLVATVDEIEVTTVLPVPHSNAGVAQDKLVTLRKGLVDPPLRNVRHGEVSNIKGHDPGGGVSHEESHCAVTRIEPNLADHG